MAADCSDELSDGEISIVNLLTGTPLRNKRRKVGRKGRRKRRSRR